MARKENVNGTTDSTYDLRVWGENGKRDKSGLGLADYDKRVKKVVRVGLRKEVRWEPKPCWTPS